MGGIPRSERRHSTDGACAFPRFASFRERGMIDPTNREGAQMATTSVRAPLRGIARPLDGDASDFDSLLRRIGEAHFVLIGEASHGTHEFYRIRAEITKRLIREKGFSAIAVEGDWPDAYRVNRYVNARDNDADATQALAGFKRFPQWMWRNADVLELAGWLRNHNDTVKASRKVGFYG